MREGILLLVSVSLRLAVGLAGVRWPAPGPLRESLRPAADLAG